MTNQDHGRIYLQPECCADPEAGRLWCEHDAPEDCEDGKRWTEYVRADLKDKANAATLQAMSYTIEKLGAENDSLRAQLEQRTDALAEIKALEAELEQARDQIDDLQNAAAIQGGLAESEALLAMRAELEQSRAEHMKTLRNALANHERLSVAIDSAYTAGFCGAASWAERDDLMADIGSPAFMKEKADTLTLLLPPTPSKEQNDE